MPAITHNLQRRRFEAMGRIKVENSSAVLDRIWKNLVPGASEIAHMMSQLLGEMTKEGLSAQLGVSEELMMEWLQSRSKPSYPRLKLIWLLWSIRFKQENLATWRSILTWGNMPGPVKATDTPPAPNSSPS